MNEIATNVDIATYLGDFTRNSMAPRFKDSRKLIKIAPGIDTEHFASHHSNDLRKSYGIYAKPTIVSVGRLVHRKGQDRLVEAMPRILAKVPDTQLVFIGEGPHRKVLEKLVSQLSLDDHVTFIGRIHYSELPRYISMGDIFAMPSRSRFLGLEVEGLGIVYLEASACGLPVIGGASGGAPDAVKHGTTGYVVDGNNVAEIADRAIELLRDSVLRATMGAAGRKWVVDEWRWEIWSQEFNKVLKI
jgi:phosphatidylinositol alpha-1,6-mannosyltransferase